MTIGEFIPSRIPEAAVVRINNKKGIPVHRSIHRFEDEWALEEFLIKVPKYFKSAEVFKINVRHATEPPTDPKVKAKQQKGQMWCPYCSDYRFYPKDTWLDSIRCEVCGISDRDFYVKKFNNLERYAEAVQQAEQKKRKEERKKGR